MRTMYDSIIASNIPRDAQIVAGYIDGAFKWTQADWNLFPNALHVTIAVFASTNGGVVLDVEHGNATPDQAVGWVLRARAAGIDPTVYCGLLSTGYSWTDVRNAFATAGVAEPHYWIAAYPGIGPNLYIGSVAHQYANPGPYDVSVVADYWPGVDSTPNIPAPIPVSSRKDNDVVELLAALYRRYIGRAPGDVETIYWARWCATTNADANGLYAGIMGATAEPGAIVVAYNDFLKRAPAQTEIDLWYNQHLSIQAMRDGIASSKEALALKAGI